MTEKTSLKEFCTRIAIFIIFICVAYSLSIAASYLFPEEELYCVPAEKPNTYVCK